MSKAAVIFWSQTGNTEQMANAIADGIREGGMEVDVLNVADTTPADAVALFGSYGWGDGQWMRDWVQRTNDANAVIYTDEGLIINETPDDDGIAKCKEFGKGFAAF